MSSGRLKALLFLPNFAYYRAFGSLVAELLASGREVLLAVGEEKGARPPAGVDHVRLPRQDGMWRRLAGATSRTLDYLRTLEPEHAGGEDQREQARALAPRAARMLLAVPPFRLAFGRRALAWMLSGVEAGLPLPRDVRALIAERRPDLILVGAAADPRWVVADYVRAAEAAATPALLVAPTEADALRTRAPSPERVLTLTSIGSNGAHAGAAGSTVDALEGVARTPAGRRRAGAIARPLLWLLSPLLLLGFVVFRPRSTFRAFTRGRADRSKARAQAVRDEKLARARQAGERKAARARVKAERAAAKQEADAKQGAADGDSSPG